MLLASDEAALFLLVRTAMIWLDALPPSEIAQVAAGFVVSLLIDLVIGAVLTIALPAAAVAYLSLRLARYGAQIVKAAVVYFSISRARLSDCKKHRQYSAPRQW